MSRSIVQETKSERLHQRRFHSASAASSFPCALWQRVSPRNITSRTTSSSVERVVQVLEELARYVEDLRAPLESALQDDDGRELRRQVYVCQLDVLWLDLTQPFFRWITEGRIHVARRDEERGTDVNQRGRI